jgi:hypothetical protein
MQVMENSTGLTLKRFATVLSTSSYLNYISDFLKRAFNCAHIYTSSPILGHLQYLLLFALNVRVILRLSFSLYYFSSAPF